MPFTRSSNEQQAGKLNVGVLIWYLFWIFLAGQIAYRLYSLHFRTAAGVAGVGLLVYLSSQAWRRRWITLFVLLLLAAWMLADACAALLVMDVGDRAPLAD